MRLSGETIMKQLAISICVAIAVSALAQGPRTSLQTNAGHRKTEFLINGFVQPAEITQWKFLTGLPGSKLSFDPHEDAGGGITKGSMKLILPFTKDGEFHFNLDRFPSGVDLRAKGFASISLDVKVDPKSPAWGDFHAGWFELGITTGKESHTFLKQYGENLDTRNGWFHISVPIIGDVSDTKGFTIKFFASGLTTGSRVVWIDNLVLSKKVVKSAAPAPPASVPNASAATPKPGTEMLANGHFADGMSKWVLEESGAAKGAAEVVPEGQAGKPALRVKVLAVEDHSWHLQVYQTGMRIEKGKRYAMTFWAKAEHPGVITVACNQNHEPWEHETNVKLPVTTAWTLLHFDFNGPWDDSNVRISFTDLGTVVGQIYWFSDCSIKPADEAVTPDTTSAIRKDGVIESWEGVMNGWHIYISDGDELGVAQATSVGFSNQGATDGKQALAVNIRDGYRKSLRTDAVSMADAIRGKRIALDVTAPEGSVTGYFKVAIAANADGMPWQQIDPLVDVPADGKPHTLIFETAAWPVPIKPSWMCFWIITNTAEKSIPGTVYFDNLRVVEGK